MFGDPSIVTPRRSWPVGHRETAVSAACSLPTSDSSAATQHRRSSALVSPMVHCDELTAAGVSGYVTLALAATAAGPNLGCCVPVAHRRSGSAADVRSKRGSVCEIDGSTGCDEL